MRIPKIIIARQKSGGSSLSAKEQIEENQLRQIHDYTRHSFQTFVSWFTVFATVNYVAFGWMVSVSNSSSSTSPLVSPLALPVASVFALQNVLAYLGANRAKEALRGLDRKAKDLEHHGEIIPIDSYVRLIVLMRSGIAATGILWLGVILFACADLRLHWPPGWLPVVMEVWQPLRSLFH
ncbi:hypothetical protein [Bradyrhizobium sp. OK095]|uniref:hypothetical protein n=1 Tax=Bradyrhizobium sp. OK095 TaxID=1882760 RepID=UPI00115FA92E|nr:hypothetical protein [Bradyrhizobium sp. OK095]